MMTASVGCEQVRRCDWLGISVTCARRNSRPGRQLSMWRGNTATRQSCPTGNRWSLRPSKSRMSVHQTVKSVVELQYLRTVCNVRAGDNVDFLRLVSFLCNLFLFSLFCNFRFCSFFPYFMFCYCYQQCKIKYRSSWIQRYSWLSFQYPAALLSRLNAIITVARRCPCLVVFLQQIVLSLCVYCLQFLHVRQLFFAYYNVMRTLKNTSRIIPQTRKTKSQIGLIFKATPR